MADAETLDRMAFEFFREFARCEYCLKAVGLRENSRNAKADWGAFAAEVQNVLEAPSTPEVSAAVAYFVEHPPKKQVIDDQRLVWDATLPDHRSKAELVLKLVCRVRNNLFHGGKFNGHWFEPQRSGELITHGLVILKACVAAHGDVGQAYSQAEKFK